MGKPYNISEILLSEIQTLFDNQKHVEHAAPLSDLRFITDGAWLKDAAVIDIINNRNGAWDVYLVFAHHKNPLQLIIRNITKCFSEQKAKATAFYIRKEAAKDRRGTLTVSIKDLNICNN